RPSSLRKAFQSLGCSPLGRRQVGCTGITGWVETPCWTAWSLAAGPAGLQPRFCRGGYWTLLSPWQSLRGTVAQALRMRRRRSCSRRPRPCMPGMRPSAWRRSPTTLQGTTAGLCCTAECWTSRTSWQRTREGSWSSPPWQDKYAPECIVGYVSRLEPLVDHATIREGGLKSLFRGAVAYLLAVVFAVGGVLWAASDLKVAKDSDAINRSAMLLVAFLVMHALGNLYTFLGPADVNSLGYFNQRLALGSPIHLLEAYLLVSLTLHAVLGLKTAWRQRRSYSRGRALKTLNLAVSGALLLVFVAVHLCQFRFGDASEVSPYYIRPPESLVDFSRSPPRFWTDDPSIQPVRVRNLYALQYKIFSDPRWTLCYS
ncbi:unnamed protein product, partial [Polarella glacialis]